MDHEIKVEIEKTIQVLKQGGVILYPTDTVWCLGCDALNSKAVDRIYKIKKRNEDKSLIVLLADFNSLYNYVTKVPDITIDLISSIEKPVTVIYDNAYNLPKNIAAPDGTIAIRVVREGFSKDLIEAFGSPIISSSANISGEPTPLVYNKISSAVIDQADYSVKMFRHQFNQGKASTIIRLFGNGSYNVIRE